jgi:hypothetical protein
MFSLNAADAPFADGIDRTKIMNVQITATIDVFMGEPPMVKLTIEDLDLVESLTG